MEQPGLGIALNDASAWLVAPKSQPSVENKKQILS